MSILDTVDDIRFDTRVMEHALRRGKITREEIATHLAELPDEAGEGQESVVPFTTPYADRLEREGGE